jgi:hypothetical protein
MSRFDYDVVRIEPSEGPHGAAGRWHRYIIANHVTSITGYRRGTRKEVAEHARQCACRLNSKLRTGHAGPGVSLA